MYSDGRKTLIKRLRRGKATREQFVSSHIGKGIGFQIRAIRDRLGWNQEELAKRAGMTQNSVSRLESAGYGKPTITTLRRLADAFDVGLIVRFAPFSEVVDWISGTPRINHGLSSESLAPEGFEEEDASGMFDSPVPHVFNVQVGGASAIALQPVSVNNTVFAMSTSGTVTSRRKPAERSPVMCMQHSNMDAGEIRIYEATRF